MEGVAEICYLVLERFAILGMVEILFIVWKHKFAVF